jgi:hypothetical protein
LGWVSIVDYFFEYPIGIGPLAIRYVEGFSNFGGCLTHESRTPNNIDFLFDTKFDSSFGDNIGPALASSAAHVAQFLIMWAVCSNVSQRIFHNASVQCQVAVLVRTNRPELLRNNLSRLCAVTAALTAGSGCKWVVDEIWGGLTVAALVAAPRMWTSELASRTSTT